MSDSQSLCSSILTKCKVSLVCSFQGSDTNAWLSPQEIAYVIQLIEEKSNKHVEKKTM